VRTFVKKDALLRKIILLLKQVIDIRKILLTFALRVLSQHLKVKEIAMQKYHDATNVSQNEFIWQHAISPPNDPSRDSLSSSFRGRADARASRSFRA